MGHPVGHLRADASNNRPTLKNDVGQPQNDPDPGQVELDRFFSVAVEHQFPDGATGWIDPGYLQELEHKAKGKRHGRA